VSCVYAMGPFGSALRAHVEGDTSAELLIRREDGLEVPIPIGHFFREASAFSRIEHSALERCAGRVLDIGAGTGLHSLELQSRGLSVTAIDVCPEAVTIMGERGLGDARCADVTRFAGGRFDTLLMLGHGVGMVEDLEGLSRFLTQARRLVTGAGQLLLDSLDVSRTDVAEHLAYHEARRKVGRYKGETRIQLEHGGEVGPFYGWLHVDPRTLAEKGDGAGWGCEVILEEESGEYLARLWLR